MKAKQLLDRQSVAATFALSPATLPGLDATGAVDVTSLLQAALATLPDGATWKLFPGTYKLTTGTLTIPANRVTLDFTGSTLNVSLPSGSSWGSTNAVVIDGNSKQGFTLRGGTWVCAGDSGNSGKNAYKVRVLSAHSCSDLTLDSMTCVGCTLGRFPNGNNINILNPKGTNTETGINYQQGGIESFLLFPNSTNVLITNVQIDGYGHGVQWDGGVNEGSGTGFTNGFANLSTVCGVKNFRIVGGSIKNCSGGGAWGSQGENTITSFLTIVDCGDVCWDPEGGKNNQLLFSTLRNGKNGGTISTFGYLSGTRIEGCTIETDNASWKLLAIYGGSLLTAEGGDDFIFTRNTVKCLASTVGSFGYQDGTYRNLKLIDNEFMNVSPSFQSVAGSCQIIKDNRLLWTIAVGNGLSCGAVFGASGIIPELRIENNRLEARVSGTVGITVFNSDGTYCANEFIERNNIFGFTTDLDLKATASSATVALRRHLRNNTLGTGTIVISHPTSGKRQQLVTSGNRLVNGDPWPKKPDVNVALGETPFANTTQFGLSEITNGTYTGIYASNFSFSDSTGEFVGVDLRFRTTIGEIAIMPRPDSGNIGVGYPVDFVLEVSSDGGSTWSTVVTKTAQAQPTTATLIRFQFAPVEADQVRIRSTKLRADPSNGAFILELSEIEVYAPGRP